MAFIGFAKIVRLTCLLNDTGIGIASPTHVAREFNRRYLGKSVTTQAVRKWLSGEAIPAEIKPRPCKYLQMTSRTTTTVVAR